MTGSICNQAVVYLMLRQRTYSCQYHRVHRHRMQVSMAVDHLHLAFPFLSTEHRSPVDSDGVEVAHPNAVCALV